jgi:hypothetical protein
MIRRKTHIHDMEVLVWRLVSGGAWGLLAY